MKEDNISFPNLLEFWEKLVWRRSYSYFCVTNRSGNRKSDIKTLSSPSITTQNFETTVLGAQEELAAQIFTEFQSLPKVWKSDMDFEKSDVDFINFGLETSKWSFSKLRRSWLYRFCLNNKRDSKFENLMWILRNLMWMSSILVSKLQTDRSQGSEGVGCTGFVSITSVIQTLKI